MVGDLHVFGVRKNPRAAPEPSSDYTTQLKNQMTTYVTTNTQSTPQCPDGCDTVRIETVLPTHTFTRRPAWRWSETYFEPGVAGEAPRRVTARYSVSGQQDVKKITNKKICVPKDPVVESAFLPDGTRVDWDITALASKLAAILPEGELDDALVSLGPFENPEECEQKK